MKKFLSLIVLLPLASVLNISAQDNPPPPKAIVEVSPTTRLSETLARNLEKQTTRDIPREKREEAYAKLLEGQRHIWQLSRMRSREGVNTGARLAKQALQRAVELDPYLAEAYTALAELSLTVPPRDAEEAVTLSGIALKLIPIISARAAF